MAGSVRDRNAILGFDSCHHPGVLFGLLVVRDRVGFGRFGV